MLWGVNDLREAAGLGQDVDGEGMAEGWKRLWNREVYIVETLQSSKLGRFRQAGSSSSSSSSM